MAAYLLLLAGGVLLVRRLLAGHSPIDVTRAVPLMLLEVTLLLTVSIAGGTRLSTVTKRHHGGLRRSFASSLIRSGAGHDHPL